MVHVKGKSSGSCPKVAILLLNYNGWADAVECLESVYRITYPNWELLFVDNGSSDGSVSKVKEWASGKLQVRSEFFEHQKREPLKCVEEIACQDGKFGILQKGALKGGLLPNQKLSILRIDKNCGFSGGNNVGIKYLLSASEPDYVLLLSNDIVVEKSFLTKLVDVADASDGIGIVGCKLLNTDGTIQSAGQKYLSDNIDLGQHDCVKQVETVPGACMLVRRKVFDSVGLLDEIYNPAYFEDADYCLRAINAGFAIKYHGASAVVHKGSKTTFSKESMDRFYFYTYCSKRNYFIYTMLHFPHLVPKALILSLFGTFVNRKSNQQKISVSNLHIRRDSLRQAACFAKALKDSVILVSKRKFFHVDY